MTVNYTADVANGSSFGCFWKILLRWKGSVYKLVWRELVAYLFLYFTINLSYRYGMDSFQRSIFEKVKVYCSRQIESIPMSFVLGFYVTLIVKRWWDQYWILPLPDSVALFISSSIHGQDERGRILRRTIMRYVVLAYIIMLQRISFRVKKRFPTLQHLVDSGLMMESEKKIFDNLNKKTTVNKFWIPIIWSTNLVNRARVEGRIHSDHMVQSILNELSEFRRRLGRVNVYDNISVPLVYTQVVTLAVYTYFTAALLGHQWVHPIDVEVLKAIYPSQELDLYFPIFLCLQFVFYIGWLKVAETLINPFGEDDDDFEINWLIDRHIQVSYLVVDEIHEEHPELLKDQYWDQVVPEQLPYNLASENFRRKEPLGSTASMKIKERESVYDHLAPKRRASMIPDEVYADYESVTDSPLVDSRKSWIQRQLSRVESFRSTSSSSSLFNRARLASGHNNNNGSLHMHHNVGAGGHRLSLYEKLMNRRSSKDHNAMRYTPKAPQPGYPARNTDKEIIVTTLMPPHSVSRPRVPTPEVMKETSLMPNDPKFLNMRPLHNSSSPRQVSPASLHNGYGVSSIYQGRVLPTVFGHNNSSFNPYSLGANMGNIPSPRSKSPLSSLYDTNDGQHIMLSPIEENDGSPYSTSSTNRSVKSSSNYPTTTAIFGRKPSPPPPQNELPPIPTENNHISSSSSTSSNHNNRSDTHIVDLTLATHVFEDLKETVINNDNEESYMTIAEINDIKNEPALPTRNISSELPPRERKKSVMMRQDAIVEEELHNMQRVHDHDDNKTLHNKRLDSNQHAGSSIGSSGKEYDNNKAEIMLTNEVLGNHAVESNSNKNNGTDNNSNQNNSSNTEVSSRKTSEMGSNTNPVANSRRVSEISNHNNNSHNQNSSSNSRKVSQNNPNSVVHSRKSSDNPNSVPNSRKTSEMSNNGHRKLSEMSNSPGLVATSRKSSQTSNSHLVNRRKPSEVSNGPSSSISGHTSETNAENSRKISDMSNSPSSIVNSRKTSEMSDYPNTANSRKSSEISSNLNSTVNSRRNSDMSNGIANLIEDFRKSSSGSSVGSRSTVNADNLSDSMVSDDDDDDDEVKDESEEDEKPKSEIGKLFEVFV